jgi:hypothetical protein
MTPALASPEWGLGAVEARFMIHAVHQQRPWSVVVEADVETKLLVVMTVYAVSG